MPKINFNPFGFFKNLFKENRVLFVNDPLPAQSVDNPIDPGSDPSLEEQQNQVDREPTLEERRTSERSARLERTHARSSQERSILRQKTQNVPKFSANISKALREKRIAPETWNPNSEEGLKKVVHDFKVEIGIDPGDVDWMENELKYAFDPQIWTDPDDAKRQLYQFPENRLSEIVADGNEAFTLAHEFYMAVKGEALRAAGSLGVIDQTSRRTDSDILFDKATNKLTEVGGNIMNAVTERDASKLAMYGVAAYAFYKLYKNLSESKSKTFDSVKKFALWGTAAYCGLSIFAPDYLKTVIGKGVHADIKGTAYETFDQILKTNPQAYASGINTGLMLKLSDAPVKALFGTITPGSEYYDKDATSQGKVHLNHPAFTHLLPVELTKARPPDGYQGTLSAEQLLYDKTSKQLFETLNGLVKMYNSNSYSRDGRSFKDKYIDTNDEYTLHDVVFYLNAFAPKYKPMILTEELLRKSRREIMDSGIKGLWVQESVDKTQSNDLKGTYNGFPIVIKYDETDGGKYNFYIASKSGPGSLADAQYLVGNKDSAKRAEDHMKTAVKTKMSELLSGVVFGGSEALEGVSWDNSAWKGKITLAGSEKFGIPAGTTIDATIKVYDDGKAVSIDYHGARNPIVVDSVASRESFIGPLVLNKLVNQKDFEALGIFNTSRELFFEDKTDSDTDFYIYFFGGRKRLTISYNKGSNTFSITDSDEEASLVKDIKFVNKYVDVFSEQNLKQPFERFEKYIDTLDQSYIIHFFENGIPGMFKGATLDRPINPSLSAIQGSVPNQYAKTLIQTRKIALEESLRLSLREATSLKDIEERKKLVSDRISNMLSAIDKATDSKHGTSRASWTTFEFMLKIVEPLKSAGAQSQTYAHSFERFENLLSTDLGLSINDFTSNDSEVYSRLSAIYYYFTIKYDKEELDKYGNDSEKKNQNLYAQYFDYVGKQITRFSKTEIDISRGPSSVPDVSVFKAKGNILEFDEWKLNGTDLPLLQIDQNPAWSNKVNDPETNRSPLEEEIVKRYKEIYDFVLDKGGDDVNRANLHFFYCSMIGLDPNQRLTEGNVGLLGSNERGSYQLALSISKYEKRSEQIRAIEAFASYFLEKLIAQPLVWKDKSLIKSVKDWWREKRLRD